MEERRKREGPNKSGQSYVRGPINLRKGTEDLPKGKEPGVISKKREKKTGKKKDERREAKGKSEDP